MPDCVRVAQTFLKHLYAGEIEQAIALFGPAMRSAATSQAMAGLADQLARKYGQPLRHSGTRTAKTVAGDAEVIYLYWDFEGERVDARIIVDATNHIVGLSFETPVIR